MFDQPPLGWCRPGTSGPRETPRFKRLPELLELLVCELQFTRSIGSGRRLRVTINDLAHVRPPFR